MAAIELNSTSSSQEATREIRGWCALCRSRCGSISVVRGGRLLEVRPDPDHPTGGALCPKGRAAPELVHSSRRLLTPLRRTRPKTDPDPGWRPIGWDEALDEIAARLGAIRAELGPEGVAFSCATPSGTMLSDSWEWIERFVRVFGSPNSVNGTELCNWHKDYAHEFTFGAATPPADYRNARLMMLWGHNPSTVWLAQADALAAGRRSGAKLLVVDPRQSAHAAQADLWLQVRPGTDAVLALGIARLLIERETYSQEFVSSWTNAPLLVRGDDGEFLRASDLAQGGAPDAFVVWDAQDAGAVACDTKAKLDPSLAGRLALRGTFEVSTRSGPLACRPAFDHYAEGCARWTPEEVERVTSVPPEKLARAAELIAQAAPAIAYHSWTGIGQHSNATQTERAIATLYALAGAFDAPGGNVQACKPALNRIGGWTLLPEAQRKKALGLERLPLGPPRQGWVMNSDFYRAVLEEKPYPVRAWVAFGSNLLLSQGDTERGRAALEKLAFHVHVDLFETPTARYADILLPANTPWERAALRLGFEITPAAEQTLQYRPAMVPPVGESRSDIWIVCELAKRLGLAEGFFGGDMEAGWNHALAPLGLTVADLAKQPGPVRVSVPQTYRKYAEPTPEGVRGFATETRRAELYSALLRRHGYPPVPAHAERPEVHSEGPLGSGRFPYLLGTAKNGVYCHSQYRGLPSLRRRAPEPTVQIGAALARAKGIAEGDWVRITTRGGAVRLKAKIEPTLAEHTLVAQYGWWQACPELGLPGYDALGPDGANVNRLFDSALRDPLSGGMPMRSTRCDVAPDPRPGEAGRWTGLREFRVAAIEPEGEDVAILSLEPADGGAIPDYDPGQYLTLRVAMPGSVPLTRSYSLCDAPAEPARRRYRVAVKRIGEAALVSAYLTRELRVGELVHAQAPAGTFRLPLEADFPVVLVAAGIGITPFMSYLEALARAARAPQVHLYYGNTHGARHAFGGRIATLARQAPWLRVETWYSRPRAEDVQGRDYQRAGRIDAQAIPQALIDRRARFYLCGPAGLMQSLRDGLVQRGVFPFEIFSEVFRSPPSAADIPAGGPFEVRLARSARTLTWGPGDGTLLDLADRAGVALPAGCRVGQCESCAVRLVSGEVRALGEGWVEEGSCLTCLSVPASDVVLDA